MSMSHDTLRLALREHSAVFQLGDQCLGIGRGKLTHLCKSDQGTEVLAPERLLGAVQGQRPCVGSTLVIPVREARIALPGAQARQPK